MAIAEHSRCPRMRPPGRVPGGPGGLILGLGRLPEREVLGVFLGVFVLRHPCAALHLALVKLRKLPVIGELVDGEIHRPVVGHVGHAVGHQPLDQRDHFREVLRGLGIPLGILDPQVSAVGVEELGIGFSDLENVLAIRLRLADDLVIHVGEVHDLLHVPAGQPEHPPQQVFEEKRAEIAEVGRVVDRGSARVHAHRLSIGGRERLDAARERVVQAELGHWRRWRRQEP
jgi:hypothetical protein